MVRAFRECGQQLLHSADELSEDRPAGLQRMRERAAVGATAAVLAAAALLAGGAALALAAGDHAAAPAVAQGVLEPLSLQAYAKLRLFQRGNHSASGAAAVAGAHLDSAANNKNGGEEGHIRALVNVTSDENHAQTLPNISGKGDHHQTLPNVTGNEDQARTQLNVTGPSSALEGPTREAAALAGKSIYFLLVDRFARADGNLTACANNQEQNNAWCGGTLRGALEKLDYIKGMEFDCVWITPVVKQYPGTTDSGTGAMGYWAQDLYDIDPHFGTKEDYRALIEGVHERNMCIIQDFVANHMGPIRSAKDLEPMSPFNKPEYFHQLFIGNMSFDEYTQSSSWPPPAQAMWSQSGAQCTQGVSCSCYKCEPEEHLYGLPSSFGPCKGEMVFDPKSPCPERALSDFCKPGDYACQGYNETITQQGWFYDLRSVGKAKG